jgi:hypothetical protein
MPRSWPRFKTSFTGKKYWVTLRDYREKNVEGQKGDDITPIDGNAQAAHRCVRLIGSLSFQGSGQF